MEFLIALILIKDESLEPGRQRQYCLKDFELIRVIGRGSYAKVLMVELKKTRRVYAMKVIKKALVTDDEVSCSVIPYHSLNLMTFMIYEPYRAKCIVLSVRVI